MNKFVVGFCTALLAMLSSVTYSCELQAIPVAEQRWGCGCSYYFPSNLPIRPDIVLQTALDGTHPIMMREGKLVSLWGAKESPLLTQAGLSLAQNFRYQATAITVENQVRPGCTWGEQGCEVVGYISQISTFENYQQCQWNLQGDCGC
ncbi:hypothetical protein F9L16_08515 [Agarivorans sp. B2Z047]|uniref:hypothetical protein n=1 Tax=Agarivorans sp. B2Z047 TaxID=2652721 RepID=UPI00128BAA66|nr:hypothetical protein [Agarivorans sp. B2Z047]MPW29036.1 hypothetical protein [Agarivorans sp. B2Z047]UQN41589.1 hypothetical protein LQZ07_17720 [Agarivorans sp. B2Z047]